MLLRSFFLILFCLCLGTPAQAQSLVEDTLPVEVMLLHYKLLNRTPPYISLINKNPEIAQIYQDGMRDTMIQQQRLLLERLYAEAGKNKPIYRHKTLRMTAFDQQRRQITFAAIPMDEPFLYPAIDGQTYAIFIRNGDILQQMAAPFEFDDFVSLDREYGRDRENVRAQLAFLPIAADPTPFKLISGQDVLVVLADIAEIKILAKADDRLLLHKKMHDDGGLPLPVPTAPAEPHNDFLPLPPAR